MEEANKDALIQQLLKQQSDQADQLKLINDQLKDLQKIKNDIPSAMDLLTHEAQQKMTKLSVEASSAFKKQLFLPKRKRGPGCPPLLESEIKDAQAKAVSAHHAARILNVSYPTYKKYARLYNIHTLLNPKGVGITRTANPNKGKYPLSEILEGKYPDFPIFRLKNKLITAKIKPAHCEQCGYEERRISDGKIPLLLVFEDGDSRNHKLENIKILCYNCSFTSGKIWMKTRDRKKIVNDPDRMQGANGDTIQKY